MLSLIADLTERGDDQQQISANPPHALKWLIGALCDRETLRQHLPLSGEDQLRVFSQFAADLAMGAAPETATLEYAIGVARSDLRTDVIASCLEKLKSHPVLGFDLATVTWSFRQPQAQILSLADYMLERLNNNNFGPVAMQLRTDPEVRQDLAAAIVALARHGRTDANALETISGMIQSLSGLELAQGGDGRRLGATLLLTAVNRFRPAGSSHSDRTALFLKLSGETRISGLTYTGTIARFDFAGVEFFRCVFEHVTWANCHFDEHTQFRECLFVGGALLHCNGFGKANIAESQLDPDARAWINHAAIADGRKGYGEQDLRNDLAAMVSKFVGRSGMGLKTVVERNLKTGSVGLSKYRDDIIRVLSSTVLDTHHVSGTSEKGYNVRPSSQESVRFFAANNVFTGPLAEAFERLKRSLDGTNAG